MSVMCDERLKYDDRHARRFIPLFPYVSRSLEGYWEWATIWMVYGIIVSAYCLVTLHELLGELGLI